MVSILLLLLVMQYFASTKVFTSWCPPCKAIAPVYEQLSKAESVPGRLVFVKINIDEQPELAA
jgi:thioredoxin 1